MAYVKKNVIQSKSLKEILSASYGKKTASKPKYNTDMLRQYLPKINDIGEQIEEDDNDDDDDDFVLRRSRDPQLGMSDEL